MKLYVDVGNSRIKWLYDGMDHAFAADSLEMLKLQWQNLKTQDDVVAVGSCVRGRQMADKIDKFAQVCFDTRIDWQVSIAKACGIVNAYTDPQSLGVDRWVALIAARARYPEQDCIVVDAGTAITVDLLDASGQHRGGVILPGAKTMFDTLNRADQLFPDTGRNLHALAASLNALTTSTQEAILAGIVFAVQGGVSAVIAQQALQISVKIETLPIILTGGDSIMLNFDSLQTYLVPDLVLEGLRVLTENRK